MTVARHPARIGVMAGAFASQQLVFAHLLDEADRTGMAADLDAVDVILGSQALIRRLDHYFPKPVVAEIARAIGDGEACVLFTDLSAFPMSDTPYLRRIGIFQGSLVRARPETSC